MIALDELAFRVIESAEPNAWVVAVADRPTVASSLRAEIERLGSPEETPPMVVTIDSAGALFEAVHARPRGTLLVVGAAAFSVNDWRSLDANRTRLLRSDMIVLILDSASSVGNRESDRGAGGSKKARKGRSHA